ncbi:EndoU domain-containing protein [Micromonospora humi]|uniref:EndoU nuclease n=1 Tax=Micromonospora humi TaxID=745366 RepID=A0A1C5II81_9ACTN|nr:EndoU domain-containing protein [Micromonospora humi]SCG57466.1 EndoU nuclease [Micromonospora humi]
MARPHTPGGGSPSHPHGDGDGGHGPSGRPHGANVPRNASAEQNAVASQAQQGRPGGGPAPGAPRRPNRPDRSTAPNTPPGAGDIRHTDASRQHILDGDGGKQGGHRAGTGLSKKTEFPKDWDDAKVLDAAHQVTQQGPPANGPYPAKDADGNPTWAYDYTGRVDGVEVKTIVLANGEIRTAFPNNPADAGVITNPAAPNPAPRGTPVGVAPHYAHPDVGGDGSWTWEGPKGNKIVRVVEDAQGNVTTTEIGDYKK